MKRMHVIVAGALGMAVAFSSCTKDHISNLSDEESRIYITNYDSAANFTSYKTFYISDSVAVIDNGRVTRQANATDRAFISAFKTSMESRGYVAVNKDANPSLGLTINRVYNTSTGIITYDNYWNGYGGYWDPYYWGYGGYGYGIPYYGYSTYSVTEGALSVDMLDLKNAATNNKINLVWNGMIRGSGIFDAATAASQVNTLFGQSSYLKTN